MINYNTAFNIISSIKKMVNESIDLKTLYDRDIEMHDASFDHYKNLILSKFILINRHSFYDQLGQLCLIFNEFNIQFEIVDLQLSFEKQVVFNDFCYISWNQLFYQLKTYNEVEDSVIDKLRKYFIIYPERLLQAEMTIRIKSIKNRIIKLKELITQDKMRFDTESELKHSNLLIKSNNRLKRLEQFTLNDTFDVFI